MYADTVLMIRPAAFAFNAETATTNFFQQEPKVSSTSLQQTALEQFDNMVRLLRKEGIRVLVMEDTEDPPKPDAIFPNNWISTDARGRVTLFPMQSESRRREKRKDIVESISKDFVVKEIKDLSHFEKEQQYLEGTGSLVIDHSQRTVYAGLSPRTSLELVHQFALENDLRPVIFETSDGDGNPIYHTNVMMCIGEQFAVVCTEAIPDIEQRQTVVALLQMGRMVIEISIQQMNCFAGNMLTLKNNTGDAVIVISTTAKNSLCEDQLAVLASFGKLLPVAVPVIEQVEGGSVRCMMAEIFLEPKR